MNKEFNQADFDKFDSAMDALDFGDLDRQEIEANSLLNAADAADDWVAVAIDTAKYYIDQGVSHF